MKFLEDLKENFSSRVGNSRIKNEFAGQGLFRHPENVEKNYVPLDKTLVSEYNASRPRSQDILCYAPFKNIYFGFDGKATACCYNREHPLGTYPQDTIEEIWFGEKAEKLRAYIKHNDLSHGCIGCKHHFDAKNFKGVQAKDFDHYPTNKNMYPSVMSFELHNTCNLECTMCNGNFSSLIRKNKENRSPLHCVYDDAFINQLEKFLPHLNYAKFYGGEPFLIEVYYQIWEALHKLNTGVRIEVQTNATVLNKKVKDILDLLDFNINLSIDSLQKETYEQIRVNARFEKTMEHVEYFSEYCKRKNTKLFVSVCPMRQNWKELPDFVRFCEEHNAHLYFHLVWSPSHCALWNLNSTKLTEIVEFLTAQSFTPKTSLQESNCRHYYDNIKLIVSWQQAALEREDRDRDRNRNKSEGEKHSISLA